MEVISDSSKSGSNGNIVKEVLQPRMKHCRASLSQLSTTAKGTGGQLALQNFSDLHCPSKISTIVKGNERSHPVPHPSSYCQEQSRNESRFVFVFMPVGTEQLVRGGISGSATCLKAPRSIFYERQETFQRPQGCRGLGCEKLLWGFIYLVLVEVVGNLELSMTAGTDIVAHPALPARGLVPSGEGDRPWVGL